MNLTFKASNYPENAWKFGVSIGLISHFHCIFNTFCLAFSANYPRMIRVSVNRLINTLGFKGASLMNQLLGFLSLFFKTSNHSSGSGFVHESQIIAAEAVCFCQDSCVWVICQLPNSAGSCICSWEVFAQVFSGETVGLWRRNEKVRKRGRRRQEERKKKITEMFHIFHLNVTWMKPLLGFCFFLF